MSELWHLLNRYWILRSEDKELYRSVKRALPEHRRFTNEQLGWNVIVNEKLIKLEKIPPRSMPWMGIAEFAETKDYCLLCAVLLYLADQDDGGQFLLSSMVAVVERYMAEESPVDWTRYTDRKALVRVLRYAQKMGLLLVYDGSSEGFSHAQDYEVLYENTGLSRYFAVHFGRDISNCRSVEDFEAFAWEGDADRGQRRINRVYRQLVLAPALYWSEGDTADYDYVKNQRQWVSTHLQTALGGELQIHRNGAFFVLPEEERVGLCHPRDLAMSDAALLLCGHLRAQLLDGTLPRREDDTAVITHREFRRSVSQCRTLFEARWGRQMRDKTEDSLCEELLDYMAGWMMIEARGEYLLLYPAAVKWTGHYPAEHDGREDK